MSEFTLVSELLGMHIYCQLPFLNLAIVNTAPTVPDTFCFYVVGFLL